MTITTLPASWFQSKPLYALERKVIFLKAWHLLGPLTRFTTPGEKVFYELAQVRVYVVNKSDTPGLPRADNINAFIDNPKSERLRIHITPGGLVFAALSAAAPPFYEYFPTLEPLLERVNFTKLRYRRSISYSGRFNWKTMIDGYQECLHCAYTHPSFSALYPPTFYSVEPSTNFCRHIADPKRPEDGLFLYFFPVCTLNVYGGGMSSFRTCPTEEPGVSRMEFDYYHEGTDEEFEAYFKFVRQVAQEDYELCEGAQRNLEAGVYGEGVLNPVKEQGVVYYQGRVRELVVEALRKEVREKERGEGVGGGYGRDGGGDSEGHGY